MGSKRLSPASKDGFADIVEASFEDVERVDVVEVSFEDFERNWICCG